MDCQLSPFIFTKIKVMKRGLGLHRRPLFRASSAGPARCRYHVIPVKTHFIYAKKPNKNGIIELREAWGTTQSNITAAMTNGRGYNKELVNCIAYFDVIKGNWRSFRFENIYKVF